MSLPGTKQVQALLSHFPLSLCVAGLIALLWASIFLARGFFVDRAITISAVTEIVSFQLTRIAATKVRLPSVMDLTTESAWQGPAELTMNAGVLVRIKRIGTGDLFLDMTWDSDQSLGAALVNRRSGTTSSLSSPASIRVSLQSQSLPGAESPGPGNVIISFVGALNIGQDVSQLTQGTMLTGRITIVERTFGSLSDRFAIAEVDLNPGDRPRWVFSTGNSQPVVSGFVHASQSEALHVTAHAAADHIVVERFGASAYKISPSWFDILHRDPIISVGLALIAFLLPFALGSAISNLSKGKTVASRNE